MPFVIVGDGRQLQLGRPFAQQVESKNPLLGGMVSIIKNQPPSHKFFREQPRCGERSGEARPAHSRKAVAGERRGHVRAGRGEVEMGRLARFGEQDRLILLRVDDYGTIGLNGPEPDPEAEEEQRSPYSALIRNNLDSTKLTTTAGGSSTTSCRTSTTVMLCRPRTRRRRPS